MARTDFVTDEFRNPPSIFWPGYFWLLNDRIDENKLISQLRDMYDKGARSLCLLPEPPEFRPTTFNTQFDRPYLSESYFQLIRKIVDECERLGMNYWLYDEGGWPSGSACGQVYAKNPSKYVQKGIEVSEIKLDAGQTYTVPADALSAYADGKIYKPNEIIHNNNNNDEIAIRIFYIKEYTSYSQQGAAVPNLLCKQATETFIELTHKQYKKYLGNHFGKTIRFTFTDEPAVVPTNLQHLTWVDDLPDEFIKRKGYDILKFIPYLLNEPADNESGDITQARIDFYDVISQLFVERYFIPIRNWCRENNLLSGGHLGGEDEPIGNAKYGYGHALRALRALDLPGVDAIWRQIFPDVRNPIYPKYASSVARQMDKPYVFTESFAVYGNGLTPWQMKWITDQQYLRGVSLMVIACYPYSTRDHFMPGERPHFGRVNPLWKYMDIYHTYTARLGYLLTRGKPIVTTAVYYDIRSIWAGASAQTRAIELHEAISETLISNQCDFDFIDDDTLADSQSTDGKLKIGAMEYDTVIVPATQWLSSEAIAGLKRFAKSGGNLIVVDGQVNGLDESVQKVASDDLAKLVRPLVRFNKPCKDIRVCKRQWDNVSLYFLTNESAEYITVKVDFDEQSAAVLCDLEEGKLYPLDKTDLEFQPWSSAVILFGIEPTETTNRYVAGDNTIIELNTGWTLTPVRRYQVGERDFEIIETQANPMAVELGDWRKYLGEYFSGDAKYTLKFDCPEELVAENIFLRLGQVKYACKVILNGQSVTRRIWQPFDIELTGRLKAGENLLEIIVTNTLANALLDPKVEKNWYSKTSPGWPSNGLVYDKLSRNFEKDSLPSGLYGPVRIVLAD